MRHPSIVPIVLLTGWALASAPGCSVILDFPQCVDDGDCTNTEGVDLVCRRSECIEPIPPSTVACEATADCIAAFDASVVCGVGNVCAGLATERCELLVQPQGVEPEAITYIGSILPRTGTYEVLGAPLVLAIQLAVEDFNANATLPGGGKVGYVACDSEGSGALAAEAAVELVAAGIDAVVGPGLSSSVIDTANVTAPAGVLLISPTASARALAALNDDDLVWRTTGNDSVQAAGIAARIAALDPPPQRVVALVKDDIYGKGLLDDLAPRLADVLPPDGLGTVLYSEVDSFADDQTLLAEYGARVATAFDRQPDVITILGSVEARQLILFYLEAWANADPRPPLPQFVVSNEALPVLGSVVDGVSDSFKPALMASLEGVTHDVLDPSNFDPWEIRYGIRFDADAGLSAQLAYDAAMAVLLVYSALPAGAVSGSELAAALEKLVDAGGPTVSFGQGLSFIVEVQDHLAAGDGVNLRGISGPLDFDVDSGDTRRDLTGWNVEPISGTLRPTLRARRHYDRATKTWSDL